MHFSKPARLLTVSSEEETAKPIIVTLQLDAETHEWLTEQRSRYFPAGINYLDAHLTLFHNLPGRELAQVIETCARTAATTAPFDVSMPGLMKLGRGVAYKVLAPELARLRALLAEAFEPWLVKQDRQGFRPHVTIQNKVAPHEAAALFDHLSTSYTPRTARAEGLQLWHYDGGPWRPICAIAFQGSGKRA
jgi:2'-5' RNA ligase